MKNLLSAICIGMMLISCSKGKQCWKCHYDSPNGQVKNTVCDKTEDEIRELERIWSTTAQPLKCRRKFP